VFPAVLFIVSGCGSSAPRATATLAGDPNPAAAARALRQLHGLPGFRPDSRCPHAPASLCVVAHPQTLLAATHFQAMVTLAGLSPDPKTIWCSPVHHYHAQSFMGRICKTEAALGPTRFYVHAEALVSEGTHSPVGRHLPFRLPRLWIQFVDLGGV
jgi:hypothetical protein